MTISKRLRYEILRRDGHRCRYCGAQAHTDGGEGAGLTLDHVVPKALGGGDEAANLVVACWTCNAGKSSTPPDAELVADVDRDALRWSIAMHAATWMSRANRWTLEGIVDSFDAVWTVYRPDDYASSIETFCNAGLDEEDIVALAEKILRDRRVRTYDLWRYFCGACWNTIKKRQESARQILAAAGDDEEKFRVLEAL